MWPTLEDCHRYFGADHRVAEMDANMLDMVAVLAEEKMSGWGQAACLQQLPRINETAGL